MSSTAHPGRWGRLLDAADRRIFRKPDLDAVARGWEVRREHRFRRTYRMPARSS